MFPLTKEYFKKIMATKFNHDNCPRSVLVAIILPFSILFLIIFGFCDTYTELPEVGMTTTQLIQYHDYPAESLRITTDDGYILEMHRIPHASSSDWVVNPPDESPAFIFADAGFDVWLGNMRGNVYSREHISYSVNSKEFWRFSWDEMAKYDLEAMIDAILDRTQQESLYYVGHSQGTITIFSKLSEDKNFSKKIKKIFALGPVAKVANIKGLMHTISDLFKDHIDLFERYFGSMEFLPSTWYIKMASRIFCSGKLTNPLCQNVMFLIGGPESNQLNVTRIPIYVTHTPAGTSTDNIAHWAQMIQSKEVQKFDFGSPQSNMKHYNQTTPPLYNLSNIDTDIYLYWSADDWVADEVDIKDGIIDVIPSIKQNNCLNDFNHFDFIYGLRARKEIYEPIIQIINDKN